MFNLDRHTVHYFLWQCFTILSSSTYWWSIFFKPLQRAASVSATKELFAPREEHTKQLFSKYGVSTKLSLELGSVVECLYKKTDTTTTNICITTATIKYSTTLLCEVASFGTAPSYVTKPTCFAFGTLISNAYKASFKNETLEFSDFAFTSISTITRVSEHFLPKHLAEYGVPFDFSFYITTFFEGALSTVYKHLISDSEFNEKLLENTIKPDDGICLSEPQISEEMFCELAPQEYYNKADNVTCTPDFCYAYN